MKKEGRKKIMPVLLTFILVLSMIVFVQSPLADVFPDGTNGDSLGLTPGDIITWEVTDGTLTADEDYSVWINGTKWVELEDDSADDDGDIAIEFHVPGWSKLGEDPVLGSPYTIELHNESNSTVATWDIYIDHYHHVKFKHAGDWLDSLIFNETYTEFTIYVYNWTGNRYELVEESIDIDLSGPGGLIYDQTGITTGMWELDLTDNELDWQDGNGNREYYLYVDITEGAMSSMQVLPVRLDITATLPTDAVWGDTVNIPGYVYDGHGEGIPNYTLRLYAPFNGSGKYVNVYETDTFSTGRYTLSASSGPDVDDASAGTWYIGTYLTNPGFPDRINDGNMYENPVDDPNFVMYHSFEVATDDSARVRVEDPDEIVHGFDQVINVSVYNSSDWDFYDEMWVHVTGIEANYSGTLYEKEDIITLGNYGTLGTGVSESEKYAYYEFTIKFEETGSGTIIVTHPYSDWIYSENDFDNHDLKANVSGSVDFSIGSPDDVNIIVTGTPDEVMIDDTDPCCWRNVSTGSITPTNIKIYGGDQDERMNATIKITGCGVDIEADEEDMEYWVDDGEYDIPISPKKAGTLTIEIENDTENLSASKDFSVKGLYGSVTTSVGDDKEIPVETTEKITVTIDSGQYAEVHLCYYDKYWVSEECINDSLVGDNTAGNGLNGEFEFIPDSDDLDHVGFLVVTAAAGSNYFYDIIDVAPIHDLVIDTIDPEDAANQTLTVGLEHEWEFKIVDGNGDIIDDVDTVTAEILDEDGDVIQTEDLKESGSKWYMDDYIPHFKGDLLITAVNNTDENEHDGNITLEVGLAAITYSPDAVTAGIKEENITVEVSGVDANGNPLPDGTRLYLTLDDGAGTCTKPDIDDYITLDEDGLGEFDIECVGDDEGKINGTFQDPYDENYMGNTTDGELLILFPNFDVNPSFVYINEVNELTITATDYEDNPIPGINITLTPSWGGVAGQPDPQETDADGQVVLSVSPSNSGKYNVTIARNVSYDDGVLEWTNDVITDTFIDIVGRKSLTITVSKSPIFEKDTLTVTITSGTTPVSEATVQFAGETVLTDSAGKASFTVPDPGVEFVVYTITAEKARYSTETLSITVIKKWDITIIGPSTAPGAGEKFTVTILAKGAPLAGATITIDGETYTSDGDGKVTITAPSAEGDYVIAATYEDYDGATITITIKGAGGIPGFELLTLIAAIGVAFILLKRRRN